MAGCVVYGSNVAVDQCVAGFPVIVLASDLVLALVCCCNDLSSVLASRCLHATSRCQGMHLAVVCASESQTRGQ